MFKLINGDCIEEMKKLIDDGIKVDLTITSPPYDDLRDYENNIIWNESVWKEVISLLYEFTKNGGVVVWVVGDKTKNGSETGTSFKQALYFMDVGFNLHDTMIYKKNGFSFPANNRYHQVFEYMFVFSRGKLKTFNPIIDRMNKYHYKHKKIKQRLKDGSMKDRVVKNPSKKFGKRYNIWEYDIGKNKSSKDSFVFEHPAIFPEKLAEDHIISWSNRGDLIFDPFMGSGTVGKMALLQSRNFIGIEKIKKYYDIAEKRIISLIPFFSKND